jgi:putative tricarboxylic transport membrane protein
VEVRGSGPPLVLLAFALAMGAAARNLGLGSLSTPGPGFFPFLNAVGLGLTALVLLAQTRRRASRDSGSGMAWVMVIALTAGITAYGILVNHVGFLLTSFCFLLLCWAGAARQPVWRSVTLAAVTTATAYFLFDYLLGVRLPRGVLGL